MNMIPEDVLLGYLVFRHSAAWRKTELIFVHVPKNGGTSINNTIYRQFMGHYRISDI
jgi:uncharacterized protein (DUF779 family)